MNFLKIFLLVIFCSQIVEISAADELAALTLRQHVGSDYYAKSFRSEADITEDALTGNLSGWLQNREQRIDFKYAIAVDGVLKFAYITDKDLFISALAYERIGKSEWHPKIISAQNLQEAYEAFKASGHRDLVERVQRQEEAKRAADAGPSCCVVS